MLWVFRANAFSQSIQGRQRGEVSHRRSARAPENRRILPAPARPRPTPLLDQFRPDVLLVENTPAFQPFTSRLPPDLVLARTGDYYEIARSPHNRDRQRAN